MRDTSKNLAITFGDICLVFSGCKLKDPNSSRKHPHNYSLLLLVKVLVTCSVIETGHKERFTERRKE